MHRLARLLPVLALVLIGAGACTKSTAPQYRSSGSSGGTTSSAPLRLGPFGIGQSATFTFTEAGLYGYHCIPHRDMGMTGSVVVDAGGADSALVLIAVSGLTYSPATVHVRTGGIVRWINASASTVHTVTSD